VVEPDADPEQYDEPAVIAQVKLYPPDPRLAVVATESVWPWSAEHTEEQATGDVSAKAVSEGSWYSVSENESGLPPVHELGYSHALLSATYTVTVQVSVADSAPTVQE
jgi:hypothetical protein